jgi:hypothetical protein
MRQADSLPRFFFVETRQGDIGILFEGQFDGLAEGQGMSFGSQGTGECQGNESCFGHAFMVAYGRGPWLS